MAIEKYVNQTPEIVVIDGGIIQFKVGAAFEAPKAAAVLAEAPVDQRASIVEDLLEYGATVAATAKTSAHVVVLDDKVNELVSGFKRGLDDQLNEFGHRNTKNTARLLADFKQDLAKLLAVRDALLQRSVLRGPHFEEALGNRLPILARGIGRVERCADTAGEKARNVGDYLLTLEGGVSTEVRIVIEAKAQKGRSSNQRIREELRTARLNRGAQAGIFVAENAGSLPDGIGFGQVTDCDFYVVFDPENGDETLLSCALVMAKAAALATVKIDHGESFDASAVEHEVSAMRKLLERFSKIELSHSKIDKEVASARTVAADLKADILAALRRLEGLIS